MEKLLLVAALACQPGDRLIDLSGKIPRGMRSMDFVVSLEPFYTQFYIYQPGFPIVDGRFCVTQSQPQMKWTVHALLRPDIEM